MACKTKKLIICVDTYRENGVLRAARVLDPDTLKVVGETQVGAWESEKAVVLGAIGNFYSQGGFRAT